MPPMCLVIATPVGAVMAFGGAAPGLAIAAFARRWRCSLVVRPSWSIAFWSRRGRCSAGHARGARHAQAIAVLGGDVYHGEPRRRARRCRALDPRPVARGSGALSRANSLPILVTGSVRRQRRRKLRGAHGPRAAAGLRHHGDLDRGAGQEHVRERRAYSAAIFKANDISHGDRGYRGLAHAARDLVLRACGHHPVPAPAERTYLGSGLDWSDLLPDYSVLRAKLLCAPRNVGHGRVPLALRRGEGPRLTLP